MEKIRTTSFYEMSKENLSPLQNFSLQDEPFISSIKLKLESLPVTVAKSLSKKPKETFKVLSKFEVQASVKSMLESYFLDHHTVIGDILASHPSLSPSIWFKVVDWIIDLTSALKFKCDAAFVAVNYFNRFLRNSKSLLPGHLEIVGLTCFFMAAKLENADCMIIPDLFRFAKDPIPSVKEFVYIEAKIMTALNFNLHCISPLKILHEIGKPFDFSTEELMLGWYLLEISLLSLEFVNCSASQSAMIVSRCIVITVRKLDFDNELFSLVGLTLEEADDLTDALKDLVELIQTPEEWDDSVKPRVRSKFQNSYYKGVGHRTINI